MKDQLTNGILTIVVQVILSITGLLATMAMTVVIQYLNRKKEEVSFKIGVDNYNHILNVAKTIFFSVEQNFTGLSGMGEQKRKLFDSILLQKMPNLTQQELDHFREGIVGEFNHLLKQSQLLEPATPGVAAPTIIQPKSEAKDVSASESAEPTGPKEIIEIPVVADHGKVTTL